MIQIIKGDILLAHEHYIGHQCNCISTKVIGLAKKIYDKYPNANPFQYEGKMFIGDIDIRYIDENRSIINIFAQYYPGKPNQSHNSILDTSKLRLRWFRKCLLVIYTNDMITELAFPYKIGCGLAGGNWTEYEMLLGRFTDAMKNKGRDVKIYKLEE